MANLEHIRRGLAAQLRTVLPRDDGQVLPYFTPNPTPPTLQVVGVDRDGVKRTGFGPNGGRSFMVVIEAVLHDVKGGRRALERLDEWLATDAIDDAVEADEDTSGALKKRLQDDGTILTNQTAAAHAVTLREYRGHQPFQLKDGRDVILAQWVVEVET